MKVYYYNTNSAIWADAISSLFIDNLNFSGNRFSNRQIEGKSDGKICAHQKRRWNSLMIDEGTLSRN